MLHESSKEQRTSLADKANGQLEIEINEKALRSSV